MLQALQINFVHTLSTYPELAATSMISNPSPCPPEEGMVINK
jgi:hypothetical protein